MGGVHRGFIPRTGQGILLQFLTQFFWFRNKPHRVNPPTLAFRPLHLR